MTVAAALIYSKDPVRNAPSTIRLDREDAEALARARKDGRSASALVKAGLKIAAARYYRVGRRKRPPSVGLFVATSRKLGDESELFEELEA